jgi:polysaccharide biosynthesis/export protein
MSTQVTVRSDGKITLPLLDEVQAAGLTPSELRARLTQESKKFFGNPSVTVVVNAINSRKVFITGQVGKPGPYVILAPTTVLQLIATAGGLRDFADSKNITIIRHEGGKTTSFPFNYKEIRKHLAQNIELKPGDTVVVP